MKTFKSITVLTIAIVAICCTTAKRAVKNETVAKIESTQVDSTAQVTDRKIDLLLRRLTETNEELSEWAAERIDYNVVDYDTLGRIVRSATQTTDRQSGRQSDRHIVDNTTTALTVSQVDSLIHLSEKRMMSKIEEINAVTVKRGLVWWQKVLIYFGVVSAIAGLFFVARQIKRAFL